jgi:hypothetical protein
MRVGLLYALFVIFALLLVTSKQTSNKQLRYDTSSSQSITINKKAAYILPEVNFSLKKFTDLNFFRLIHIRLFKNTNNSRIDLSAPSLRLLQTRAVSFKPIKQKPFLFILHYSSEKEDNHHLS